MRLVTRSDFDGLACGVLLYEIGVVDSCQFAHPKDLQDGIVDITDNDVLTNVPFVEGCGLWFDHHTSEQERIQGHDYKGSVEYIDSAAHVIYNYYSKEHDLSRFDEMIKWVDAVDAAKLTVNQVLNPEGWIMLGFIMDPRTGLGRFHDFTISNYQLMEKLMDACRSMQIDEILSLPDVQERIEVYREQNLLFKHMIEQHSYLDTNIIVTDLRGVRPIYSGNRFLVYSLFPNCNISMWVVDGKQKNVAIAVGKSIFDKTNTHDVGSILLEYGGGGHPQVGTCQIDGENADDTIIQLRERFKD